MDEPGSAFALVASCDGATAIEKHRLVVFDTREAAADAVVMLMEAVGRRVGEREMVLGLATGSTPIPVYQRLVAREKDQGAQSLTWQRVRTFNLDEYLPMQPDNEESYHHFMHHHLFSHIPIAPENVHIPPGDVEMDRSDAACTDYERAIEQSGGIDLQLLGIGQTGHIGFNEPGSARDSRTRRVELHERTISDARAAGFKGEVPRHALTMGVGTIMDSRAIVLMAWGEGKASIITRALTEGQTSEVPATFLRSHPNAVFVVDRGAASLLPQ